MQLCQQISQYYNEIKDENMELFIELEDKKFKIDSLQDEIKKKLHFKHHGKIFVLTSPRYFGYCFNPVSFYYCFNLKNKLEKYYHS